MQDVSTKQKVEQVGLSCDESWVLDGVGLYEDEQRPGEAWEYLFVNQ